MDGHATSSAPELGDTVGGGKYQVIRLLGRGGMGAVFEAEHTLTKKRVALKWMSPALANNPEAAERLVREAQASARVRHPNSVDIYDVVRENGELFLVMEYLEGEPLSQLLERGGLPMHRMIALLLPAMRAVAAAHKQGVVHRDIKPDNIFLAHQADAPQPVPKVLDFGISKLVSRGADQLSLTLSGSTMGTPRYMSYEQLNGEKTIDGRADVYAFGVILYEALTGRLPFDADTFPELIVKMATQAPVPLKELRSEIPTPLERIVLWAMARDRAQRLPSMEALIQELQPFATEHGFRTQMTQPDASIPRLPGTASEAEVDHPVRPQKRVSLSQAAGVDGAVARTRRTLLWSILGLLACAGLAGAYFWQRTPAKVGLSVGTVAVETRHVPPRLPEAREGPSGPERTALRDSDAQELQVEGRATPLTPEQRAPAPVVAARPQRLPKPALKAKSAAAGAPEITPDPGAAPVSAARPAVQGAAAPPAETPRGFRVPNLPKPDDF